MTTNPSHSPGEHVAPHHGDASRAAANASPPAGGTCRTAEEPTRSAAIAIASVGGRPTTETRAQRRKRARGSIIPSSQVRGYLYLVLAAAGPLVVFYGIATNEEVALWLGLGATILGTPTASLARANLS